MSCMGRQKFILNFNTQLQCLKDEKETPLMFHKKGMQTWDVGYSLFNIVYLLPVNIQLGTNCGLQSSFTLHTSTV